MIAHDSTKSKVIFEKDAGQQCQALFSMHVAAKMYPTKEWTELRSPKRSNGRNGCASCNTTLQLLRAGVSMVDTQIQRSFR